MIASYLQLLVMQRAPEVCKAKRLRFPVATLALLEQRSSYDVLLSRPVCYFKSDQKLPHLKNVMLTMRNMRTPSAKLKCADKSMRLDR